LLEILENDLFACKFIHFYTGRGRAKGSKSILLTYEGWIQQKEMVNLLRERLMKTAIEIIKTKSEAWFIEQISTRIKQMRQEKDIEKNMRETKRKLLGNKQCIY